MTSIFVSSSNFICHRHGRRLEPSLGINEQRHGTVRQSIAAPHIATQPFTHTRTYGHIRVCNQPHPLMKLPGENPGTHWQNMGEPTVRTCTLCTGKAIVRMCNFEPKMKWLKFHLDSKYQDVQRKSSLLALVPVVVCKCERGI